MNLVKWFRKNNKKVMAVVVIVIMFGFVGGSALQRLLQGTRAGRHETVAYFHDNRKITNYDLVLARQELEILKMLQADTVLRSSEDPVFRVPDLRTFLLGELLFFDRAVSPALIGRIKQVIVRNEYTISPKQINDIYRRSMPSYIYWLLLKKEAELAGIRMPNKRAGRYLAGMYANNPRLFGGAVYSRVIASIVNRYGIPEDQTLTAFGKLLAVLQYANLICSDEGLTTQQIRHNISWVGETIDVEFVRFNSSVFAEDQNEPAQQKISAHFDKYKEYFAGAVSEQNPYGFGYKLADRVRLEYIAVKLDDVSQIIAKPTQEEAEEYYRRYTNRFTEQVLSDPNDPNSLTERIKSYAEVASDVSDLLLRDKINSKARLILQEAKTLTEAAFEDIDTEPANLSAEQFKAMAGDYEIAAEQLSEKYKIKVYAGQTGLLSAADMQAEKHVGRLYVRGYGYYPVALVQIVFAIDELGTSELGPFDAPKPRMYENIGPAVDITGQIVGAITGQIMAVVRVVEAQKTSEPESVNQTFDKSAFDLELTEEQANKDVYSIREEVVQDLKKLAAMDTVKREAEEFKDLAVKQGWEEAVNKFNKLYGKAEANEADPNTSRTQDANEVQGPFRLETLTNLQRFSSMGLGTLAVQDAGNPRAQFRINILKKESMLRDRFYSLVPQDANSLDAPQLVEFKPDMSYYCLRSVTVKRISRNEYEKAKVIQGFRAEAIRSQSLAAVHFNPENILERMDFREKKRAADANEPAEANTLPEAEGDS